MHDWTIIDLTYDWKQKECSIRFKDSKSEIKEIKAYQVEVLSIPHNEGWGPSVSVNEVIGPTTVNDAQELKIEIQSGDTLTIRAESFTGIQNY